MSFVAHLPAIIVIAPLLAALLCALVRRGWLAWYIATFVSWATLLGSAVLLVTVMDGGTMSYKMGGWQPPFGIEYRVDVLSGFILLLVSLVASVMLPYANMSVDREIAADRQAWFYAMYLTCLSGLFGISVTGDAFNVFVFLEVSSLSTYAMVAMGRDPLALVAAYRYLIMGTIGATCYVIAIGLLYNMTGTLNLVDLSGRIAELGAARPVFAALAFITVGIALKFALFPLHAWLPNAYAYAPSFATAFLAASATKVSVYLILRFYYSVYGANFAFSADSAATILLVLSVMAMFIASIVAVFQVNVKRLLAYSSVAQIGYITLGISLATQIGLTAGIVHIFNHAIIKGSLFLALGCVVYSVGAAKISDLAGMGRKMPWTMGAFVIGGLAIIGVPGTAGFISKWYLALAVLDQGWWWMVLLLVLSSLIAVLYIGKVVEAAYFREPGPDGSSAREAPLPLLIPTWVLALSTIYFGFDTTWTVDVAAQAAQLLLEGVQ